MFGLQGHLKATFGLLRVFVNKKLFGLEGHLLSNDFGGTLFMQGLRRSSKKAFPFELLFEVLSGLEVVVQL